METPAPAVPDASAAPGATPAPEPDYTALAARAEAVFQEAFSLDPSAFALSEMQYITELMAQYDVFLAMQDALKAAAHSAFAEAYSAVCGEYPALPAGRVSVAAPGWQELMSLHRVLGAQLAPTLAEHCAVHAELTPECVSFSISFAPPEAFVGASGEAHFSFTTLYAYLNTIYDETGAETEYVDEPLPEEYLATLADPLPGRHIKDGWYGARPQNTRMGSSVPRRTNPSSPAQTAR